MSDERDVFGRVMPPAPPPALRVRVLASAAAADANAEALGSLLWSSLRPQLGWIFAVLLLLAAHVALDAAWPVGPRADRQASPPGSRPEVMELRAAGVPEALAERFTSDRGRMPEIEELVQEVM